MDIAAYQGEAGAFSEEGALALFPEAEHRPLRSIRKVFEAVEVGRARWGLVPMDNSQAGSINETYDLFLRHGLHLVGETVVRVDHCLVALPGSTIDDLREVISHPQAIAQCEEFLNALEIDVRAEYNTAGAAKRITEERLDGTAAIASRRAAELYGLEVLAERIQTYPDNSRRAAPEPHEARVEAAARPPLGIRLLRGRRSAGARAGDGRGAGGVERTRNVHASTRLLRRRDPAATLNRGPQGGESRPRITRAKSRAAIGPLPAFSRLRRRSESAGDEHGEHRLLTSRSSPGHRRSSGDHADALDHQSGRWHTASTLLPAASWT